MTKKEWPYRVTAVVHELKFRELLTWLHDAGHTLHATVKFGKQHRLTIDSPMVKQEVAFKDGNQAMIFKLAWGGK
jgi:hypothetical protein